MEQTTLIFVFISTFMQNLVCSASYAKIFRDEGDNVTLICPNNSESAKNINWIVSDGIQSKESRLRNGVVRQDGSLFLTNVTRSDSHIYSCQDAETNQSLGGISLLIRGTPSAVNNLTVLTHSVYALVTWQLDDDGGYPIQRFSLKYRIEESNIEDFKETNWTVLDDIRPNTSSVAVFHLLPNSTYYFRVQAVNQLGVGPEVSVMATTKYDPDEVNRASELLSMEKEKESSKLYVK